MKRHKINNFFCFLVNDFRLLYVGLAVVTVNVTCGNFSTRRLTFNITNNITLRPHSGLFLPSLIYLHLLTLSTSSPHFSISFPHSIALPLFTLIFSPHLGLVISSLWPLPLLTSVILSSPLLLLI